MLNIKKKDYNNWLFYLEHLNNNNKFISFFQINYAVKDIGDFSLLRSKHIFHKIPSFYLAQIAKIYMKIYKGIPVYCLSYNDDFNYVMFNKYVNFIFFASRSNGKLFIYKSSESFSLVKANLSVKKFILKTNSIVVFNILILRLMFIFFIKLIQYKINDIFN